MRNSALSHDSQYVLKDAENARPNNAPENTTAEVGAQMRASQAKAVEMRAESSRICSNTERMVQTPACACPARHRAHWISLNLMVPMVYPALLWVSIPNSVQPPYM